MDGSNREGGTARVWVIDPVVATPPIVETKLSQWLSSVNGARPRFAGGSHRMGDGRRGRGVGGREWVWLGGFWGVG